MKERALLFSAPMVRAAQSGRKNVTRRDTSKPFFVGQTLWVRESWYTEKQYDDIPPRDVPKTAKIHYAADVVTPEWCGKCRPSIFLPRWASRLSLEVVSVRVEHIQELDASEARKEGASTLLRSESAFVDAFRALWDGLNGHRPGFSWDDNPEVQRVEFRRIES